MALAIYCFGEPHRRERRAILELRDMHLRGSA